jgi:hypothetical protein
MPNKAHPPKTPCKGIVAGGEYTSALDIGRGGGYP